MKTLIKVAKQFLHDEHGVTAIEYGLMAVLIALVMAGGAVVLGDALNKVFGDIGNAVKSS